MEGLEHRLRNTDHLPYAVGESLKQRDEMLMECTSKNHQLMVGEIEGLTSVCLENMREEHVLILGPYTFAESYLSYFSGCREMHMEVRKPGKDQGSLRSPFPDPSCLLPG